MPDPTRADQMIGSIMQRGVLILPQTTTVEVARRTALPGQIVVVLNERHRPVGILLEERLAFLEAARPLWTYSEHLVPVTLTRETAPVEVVLAGMWADPLVRWHVVMLGHEVQGVVSPNMLLEAYRRRTLDWLLNAPRFRSENPGHLSLAGAIQVTSKLCWRCPGKGVAPRHCVKWDREKYVNGWPTCPLHDQRLEPENPCEDDLNKCY